MPIWPGVMLAEHESVGVDLDAEPIANSRYQHIATNAGSPSASPSRAHHAEVGLFRLHRVVLFDQRIAQAQLQALERALGRGPLHVEVVLVVGVFGRQVRVGTVDPYRMQAKALDGLEGVAGAQHPRVLAVAAEVVHLDEGVAGVGAPRPVDAGVAADGGVGGGEQGATDRQFALDAPVVR